MKPHIVTGRCSLCRGRAEKLRRGGWWHVDGPCSSAAPLRTAEFEPDQVEERQQRPPRNRQIPHPPEDR